MTLNVFCMMIFLFIPTVSAVVQLSIITPVAVNIQVQVLWKRENSDPQSWDLNLLLNGQPEGVATTVTAQGNALSGVVPVIFPGVGQFTLQAVTPNDNQVIASINGIQVGVTPTLPSSLISPGSPSSTSPSAGSTPQATSFSSTTHSVSYVSDVAPPSATTTSNASTTSSTVSSSTPSASSIPGSASETPSSKPPSHKASSMPPAVIGGIVGGVVGGVLLLAVIAILGFLYRRRRQHATRRITFNRDLMVQYRDVTLPPSTYNAGIVPVRRTA